MQGVTKLISLFRLLGWVVLGFVVLVQVVEHGGWTRRWMRSWLDARLASVGAELRLGEVDVRWLEPAVVLRDFSLEERGELLAAEELRIVFDLSTESGFEIERVEVSGGRVRYGPALVNSLRGLFDLAPPGAAQDGDPSTAAPRPLPSMRVRDLAWSLEHPGGGTIPLGVLALDVDGRSTEDAKLRALVHLTPREGREAPVVRIRGDARPGGRLALEGWGEGLQLADWRIPEIDALRPLAELEPRGTLSLSATGTLSWTGEEQPSAALRLALDGGAVRLPFENQRLEQVDVRLELAFAPNGGENLWSLDAWAGRGELGGTWETHPFRGGLRLGAASTAGTWFEQWMRIERLPLGDPLLELLGRPPELAPVESSVEAEGHADLTVAVRCHDSWSPPEDPLPHIETLAVFDDAGDARATWMGWPRHSGRRPFGFPMPARIARAHGVFAHAPRLVRPNHFGLVAEGRHDDGPVEFEYATWSSRVDTPPFAPGYGRMEADLWIDSSDLRVDDELRRAVEELGDVEPAIHAWRDYAPVGGSADGRVHVASRSELLHPVAHVVARLEGVALTPRLFPVELHGVDAELEVLSDGADEVAVRFEAEGQLHGGSRARLEGRLRAPSGPESEHLPLDFEIARLRADAVDFGGPTRRVIDAKLPGVAAVLTDYAPRGAADVSATLHRPRGASERRLEFGIAPAGDVSVTPSAFPIRAERVRGRVFVSAVVPTGPDGEGSVATRVAPLFGVWPDDVPISFHGEFPADAPGAFDIRGAGLRLFSGGEGGAEPTVLLRRLDRELQRATGVELVRGIEEESLALLGNLDFHTTVDFGGQAAGTAPGTHVFHLRGCDLDAGGALQLEDIVGRLVVAGGIVANGRVAGTFAGTRIRGDGLVVAPEDGGWRLDLDFEADDVPLDPEHLAVLLDERTRTALFDDLQWRGRIDVPDGHLTLRRRSDGGHETRLSGDLVLTDWFLDLGLPLSIRSARGTLRELVVDEAGVRAWGRLDDLYGEVAERDIGPASMLVGYHGSRLTIDELEAVFERGEVFGYAEGDSASTRAAPAFAVDLVEPFPFLLAIELERIDAARLLAGVFASNIADRGDLNARLRLSGLLEDPLSLEGRGGGEVTATRLWSVPVFRDLFYALGYDATAVFDSMSSRFHLQDGLVRLSDVHVHSPLFRLVGDGELDLDGRLAMDLEIRYSLVDKVPLITWLVYLVQNTLLEVAIRGDLSRPQVILQGALTRLVQDIDGDERGLPIPRQSRLPERF